MLAFFVLRLATLWYSIQNEKRLRQEGAVEYGKTNSMCMAILHVLFYIAATGEAYYKGTEADATSSAGIVLFAFSYIVLLYVIYQLRDVWTVKLYIANTHKINTSALFRIVRHPNYFLNIVPELIGVGLLCKAWYTMAAVLPFYAVTVIVRIAEEERVMQQLFAASKQRQD